jgi:RES domain-containing protein
MLHTAHIDRRDTHELVPARFADGGISVLSQLSDDPELLEDIVALESVTNRRVWSEADLMPGITSRELVFGIPAYRIINAAFCYPSFTGSRFNSSARGAWYAAFELETSQAEVVHHRKRWLEETKWQEEEATDYVDYLADFRAEFHDIRGQKQYANCLSPDTHEASQKLAEELLKLGSAGIVYPSVRRPGGTCIVCFRPVLVTNVRQGETFKLVFPGGGGSAIIRSSKA